MNKVDSERSKTPKKPYFRRTQAIEHLYQADKIIDSMDYSNRLADCEREKWKKVYSHWLEFIFKNAGAVTLLGLLMSSLVIALSNYHMVVLDIYLYKVNIFSIISNFGTVEIISIIIFFAIMLCFPLFVYLYVNLDCYFAKDSAKRSRALVSFRINYSCNSFLILITLMLFSQFDLQICLTEVITWFTTVGFLCNLIFACIGSIKYDGVKTNAIAFCAAFIALIISLVLTSLIVSLNLSFINSNSMSLIIKCLIIFGSTLGIWITPSRLGKKHKKTQSKEDNLRIEENSLLISEPNNESKVDSVSSNLTYSNGVKRCDLVFKLMFRVVTAIATFFFIASILPLQTTTTQAKVAEYKSISYIIAADCGNYVCLEPLILNDSENGNKLKEEIVNLQNGTSTNDVTITSNMINAKVQKWVSKNDLEMVEVTYKLESYF